MPTLRISLPDKGDITHELAADRITIGRRPDNTIQIVDRSVSAHHAELIAEDGHYRLHDLGSTNLTFVDGLPVTDFHLHDECRISFGTIQCTYEPRGGSGQPRMSMAQMEKDLAFLRGENSDLLGQIVAMQRQIDILSSARLVTRKADNTPFAAANDTLKSIVAERDDLRHMLAGMKLEMERLKEELSITAKERDAARQACELLQAEKVTNSRELRELRHHFERDGGETPVSASAASPGQGGTAVIGAPVTLATPANAAPPTSRGVSRSTVTLTTAHDLNVESGATQKITLPLSPAFQAIAAPLKILSSALHRLALNPDDRSARPQLAAYGSKLAQTSTALGGHPVARLSLCVEAMLQECLNEPDSLRSGPIHTLVVATDVIGSLLDPRNHDQGKALPHPKVLAVDDDIDLLHTLAASLELAQLPTTTCVDCQEAQAQLDREEYDVVLLDIALPVTTGPTFCEHLRADGRHQKTPVIFLTAAGNLDGRAQATLSGGNDFLAKPFSSAELAVKVETWIWKHRFGLL